MAGGFWKGLLHGAVVGVVGLGGLSLLNPVTREDKAPQVDAGGKAEPTESTPAPAQQQPETEAGAMHDSKTGDQGKGAGRADISDNDDDNGKPQAMTVELPAGSEFGRGSDTTPRRPAALPTHAPVVRPSPLAATAPADEAVSARELPAELRPDSGMPAQSELPESETMPEFDLPGAQPVPTGGEAPALVGLEAPDSLPATAIPQLAEPQITEQKQLSGQEQDSDAVEQDAGGQEAAQASPTPVLPAPSLDLSMPPDLSELRALERD